MPAAVRRGKVRKRMSDAGVVTLLIAVGSILAWGISIAAGGGSAWGLFLSGGGYMREWGKASFAAVLIRKQWWRLLTCGYLHLGVFHLGFNVYALFAVGSKMEKCLGHIRFCMLYHFGMVVTVFLWCLLFRGGSMVGASSGIFVVLGAYMALRKSVRFQGAFSLSAGHKRYLVLYALISCLVGIETIAVHCIGFVVGGLSAVLYQALFCSDK